MQKTNKVKRLFYAIYPVVVLVVLLLGFFINNSLTNKLKNQIKSDLKLVALLKSSEIHTWLDERMQDVQYLVKNPNNAAFFTDLIQYNSKEIRQKATYTFGTLVRVYKYDNILVTDTAGNLIFSLDSNLVSMDSELKELMHKAKAKPDSTFFDLYRSQQSGILRLDFVAAIYVTESKVNKQLGYVIYRTNPNNTFFPLLEREIKKYETAEVLVFKYINDSLLVLNNMQYLDKSKKTYENAIINSKKNQIEIATSRSDFFEGNDYRNKSVIGYRHSVGHSDMCFLDKVDTDEAFLPVYQQTFVIIIILVLVLGITSTLFFALYYTVQRNYFRQKLENEIERKALLSHFEFLIKNANDSIILANHNCEIIEANLSAINAYGLDANNLSEVKLSSLGNFSFDTNLKLSLQTKTSEKQYEAFHFDKNHKEFQVEISEKIFEIEGKPYYQAIIRNITSRKLFENALRDSEMRLQNVVNSQTCFVLRTDMLGKHTYWNGKYEEVFGWIYDNNILNTDSLNSICKHHHQKAFDAVKQCVDFPGTIVKVELDKPTKDGSRLTTLWEFVCLTDKNNTPTEIQCMGINITDRVLVEKQLTNANEKYRSLLESSDAAIMLISHDGFYLYVNEIAAKPFGGKPEDLVGVHVSKLFPADQTTAILNDINLVIHANEGKVLETEVLLAGVRSWFRTSIQPVRDESGKPDKVLMYATNITESKLANNLVEQNEKKYKALFFESPDAYLIIKNGVFVECNNASAQMLRCKRIEILGKTPSMISPEYQPGGQKSELYANQLIAEVFKLGKNSFEWCHKRSDGTEFLAIINLAAIEFENHQALFVTWRDITQIREIENALVLSEESLNFAQEIANMGSWEYDFKSGKVTWSKNYRKLLDVPQDTPPLSLEQIRTMVHENDRNLFEESSLRVLNTKQPESFYFRLIGNQNTIKWIQAYLVPKFEAGEISGLSGVSIDVTDKMLAQQEIQQKNQKLNAIMNALPDEIFVHDQNGKYLEAFSGNSSKFPIPLEQILQSNLFDLFETEGAALNLEKIQESLQTGQLTTLEFSTSKYGKLTHLEARIIPLNKQSVIRFVRDITERKNSDDEIKKLSLALEQSPVGIVITDMEPKIIYANKSITTTTGYELHELIGQNPRLLKSNHTPLETYIEMWDTILAGKVWLGELLNKKKSGKVYWESMSITPITDDLGQITNYLAVKQDISERKKFEYEILELNASLEERVLERTIELAETNEELQQEIEERQIIQDALEAKSNELENFFTVTLDLLCIADLQGHFLKVNKAWGDILGYADTDLENKLFLDFVHPDDLQATLDALSRLGESKPVLDFTNRYKKRDSTYRFIEWHSVPVGKLIYSAARDVTGRMKIEQELRLAREDADNANKQKSNFLANMSHEIRTPMNAILGFSEILRDKIDNNPETREYLEGIQRSGKNLVQLINDILDLAKIEAGQLEVNFTAINPYAIIEDVKQVFSLIAKQKNIEFNVLIEQQLPNCIMLDELRVRQILFNLLGNAVKFTTGGNITIQVQSYLVGEKDKTESVDLIISISDTGIGIPETQLKTIFDPFKQQKGQSQHFGGTGLGLSITKRLVEMMNGTIAVESKHGVGTTFKIHLRKLEIAPFQATERKFEPVLKNVRFKKAEILIVEDIEENRMVIKGFLQAFDMTVFEAENGLEALKFLEKQTVDLIITDIQMPIMDGEEFVRNVKGIEELKTIPIIMWTAAAMKDDIAHFKNMVDSFLLKPTTKADLIIEMVKYLAYEIVVTGEEKAQNLENFAFEVNSEMLATITPEFLTDLEQWFQTSGSARKSLNTLNLTKAMNELEALAHKHSATTLISLAQEIKSYIETFALGKISAKLNEFENYYNLLKNNQS